MVELQRRKLMTGAAAVALFGALGVDPAQARRSIPPAAPVAGMNRLQAIMATHDVTILGDTNHAQDMYGFLSDPNFLKAAQESRVGTIAVEVDSNMQIFADQLAAGKMTRREFCDDFAGQYQTLWPDPGKFYNNLASAVQQTHARGIKLVFADKTNDSAELQLQAFEERYASQLDNISTVKGVQQTEMINNFDRNHGNEIIKILSHIMKDRISNTLNTEISSTITNSSEKRQNIVVMFGMEHSKLLQQAFQKSGMATAVVALHADAKSFRDNKSSYKDIDFSEVDNFLVDTRCFSNDPPTGPSPHAVTNTAPKQKR